MIEVNREEFFKRTNTSWIDTENWWNLIEENKMVLVDASKWEEFKQHLAKRPTCKKCSYWCLFKGSIWNSTPRCNLNLTEENVMLCPKNKWFEELERMVKE